MQRPFPGTQPGDGYLVFLKSVMVIKLYVFFNRYVKRFSCIGTRKIDFFLSSDVKRRTLYKRYHDSFHAWNGLLSSHTPLIPCYSALLCIEILGLNGAWCHGDLSHHGASQASS